MRLALRSRSLLSCTKTAPAQTNGFWRNFSSSPQDAPVDPSTLDWPNIGFKYYPTKGMVSMDFKDGAWSSDLKESGPTVDIHILSNVLHYGQALFEGLKAFRNTSGEIFIFNPKENSKRMNNGAARVGMPPVPELTFLKACEEVVKLNKDYVPPHESGGALYLRPFLFGHGAQLGLGKAPMYKFGVISSPVGLYYPSGLKAVDALLVEKYDRAAPQGVGNVKVAGNYAADIVPASESQGQGFPISLYLDAREHKYIEEFSTSNFIAITKDGSTFVTPKSDSVLPSITNLMLRQLAAKKGLKVEQRPIAFSEVEEGKFSEVAACGTAVIVTPIRSITKGGKKIEISENLNILEELYHELRGIQSGDLEDTMGWCHHVKV